MLESFILSPTASILSIISIPGITGILISATIPGFNLMFAVMAVYVVTAIVEVSSFLAGRHTPQFTANK
jgi:hypothetical protein